MDSTPTWQTTFAGWTRWGSLLEWSIGSLLIGLTLAVISFLISTVLLRHVVAATAAVDTAMPGSVSSRTGVIACTSCSISIGSARSSRAIAMRRVRPPVVQQQNLPAFAGRVRRSPGAGRKSIHRPPRPGDQRVINPRRASRTIFTPIGGRRSRDARRRSTRATHRSRRSAASSIPAGRRRCSASDRTCGWR